MVNPASNLKPTPARGIALSLCCRFAGAASSSVANSDSPYLKLPTEERDAPKKKPGTDEGAPGRARTKQPSNAQVRRVNVIVRR